MVIENTSVYVNGEEYVPARLLHVDIQVMNRQAAEIERLTAALVAERARVAVLVAAGDAMLDALPDSGERMLAQRYILEDAWEAARKEADHA